MYKVVIEKMRLIVFNIKKNVFQMNLVCFDLEKNNVF